MASSIPTTQATESAAHAALARRRRTGARLFRIGSEIPRPAYTAIAALSFILPLLLWCFFTYSGRANALILPTPTRVINAAIDMYKGGTLLPDIQISVYRIGMGFLLSALLAIPVGILMGAYKSAEAAHEPLVGFIRYIPVPALIPLVMVIAGIDEAAKIALIFIGTYFQMVLVVADVTRQVPRDLLNAARTLGANGRQLLFNVLLPATLPGLLDTCRTMIGWAWTYLVIAEVVATSSGMGYMLLKAQRFSRSDEMFVGIIILGVLGLLTDLAFKLIQPRLVPWADLNKN
ncbi:MAG: ABC transporter permease [Capsulimonas sp.]|uniref:ABC transporter permease n=1 Tax=Capsulimonas sp. TaxID=2494211 RepID=UPI003262D3CF